MFIPYDRHDIVRPNYDFHSNGGSGQKQLDKKLLVLLLTNSIVGLPSMSHGSIKTGSQVLWHAFSYEFWNISGGMWIGTCLKTALDVWRCISHGECEDISTKRWSTLNLNCH